MLSPLSFIPIKNQVFPNNDNMVQMRPPSRIDFGYPLIPQLTTHQTMLALAAGAQRENILKEIEEEIVREIYHSNYQKMKDIVDQAVAHPLFDYPYSKQLVDLLDEYFVEPPYLSTTSEAILQQKKIAYENTIQIEEKIRNFVICVDDYISQLKEELSSFSFFKDRKKEKLTGAYLLKETVQSLISLASGKQNYALQMDKLRDYLRDNKNSLEGTGTPRFKLLIQEFQSLVKIARQKYPPGFFGADLSSEDALIRVS